MFRRIVVPLDGTPFGRIALSYATVIACRAGADIELVHVHVPEHLEPELFELTPFHFTGVVPGDAGLDRLRMRREAEQLEEEARDLCRSAGLRVTSRAVAGTIDAAIEREARTFDAELIVMATHDAGGSARTLFRSVGRGVAGRASVPVLLVHPPDSAGAPVSTPDIRRIIVALDGSPFSEQVLGPAGGLARIFGSTMHLLHVDVPLRTRIPADTLRAIHATGAAFASGLGYLQDVARVFEPLIGQTQIEVVASGSPGAAILDAALRARADVLAMATHGRAGLRRFILGSTADEVLLHARLPILLFRPGRQNGRESIVQSTAAAHTIV